ncbi:MAG: hypothetical protein CSA23_05165 [Deltaproteobacteria bacterium]|nr:MAG: hypothetical protein CSA23_05165 [Deltaproteobacteria bacterium]
MTIRKWPICPISALYDFYYPRNINQMPSVIIFVSLDLDIICLSLDRHELKLFHPFLNFSDDHKDNHRLEGNMAKAALKYQLINP